MDEATRMIALANSIKEHVEKLTKYQTSSHDDTTLPLELLDSKSKTLQAIDELQALVRGPLETIIAQTQPEFLSLKIVHDFQLATAVPLEEGAHATYHELAAKSGLGETAVRSILRSAMLKHIFDETKDGFVVHTPTSRLLAEDSQVQACVDFALHHIVPAELKLTEAMKLWPQSMDPSQTGFALAHDNQGLFSYLKSNPQAAKSFSLGINAMNRLSGIEVFHITQNLPKMLRRPGLKWVDIGGGDGYIMTELARSDDSVRCVVQDLPQAIKTRRDTQYELEGRVSFMPYDFFTPQPIVDADVYFLRQVLHNWNDSDCIRILKVVSEAMKPSAKIVINDRVLPEKGEGPATMENKLRLMDLLMRVVLNSHSRDMKEWVDLLTNPVAGLEIEEVIRPNFSDLAIFVLRLKSAEEQAKFAEA